MDTIRANALDFAYLSEGTGPLVLLLHGFPDTAHTWDRVLPKIAAAGYRAVAPFMRGYHPTSIPADGKYDVATLGRDVIALIEAFGEQQAIVVGHDWGAAAAYVAAGMAPERVRMLITLAIPHPKSLKPSPTLAWKARHFLALRGKRAGERLRAHDFAYLEELWRRWSPAWRDIPASELAQAKACLAHPGSAEAACAYYAAATPGARKAFKPQIKVPSVAFAGEHDMMVPRAFEKARLCYDASYEVVIVPGGHFMHREHPEPFNSELVRILTEARSAAA